MYNPIKYGATFDLIYFVLVPDGMADTPLTSLGGKTPMGAAFKPNMDKLAARAICGTVSNVPEGMVPESDTANLSILSYNPRVYSKGRSPLEAVSMGIDLRPDEVAIRCNLVTLSEEDDYTERTMIDHSADEITTEEARELINALNEALANDVRRLYTGISYRHCLVLRDDDDSYLFMRPHDILGQKIKDFLPSGERGQKYLDFMMESARVLEHHPVNEARRRRGLRPANSTWLWSPGKKPSLPSFYEKWGLRGCVVCAVDLIRGISICAGMETPAVEGATGNIKTNYKGKAQAAIDAFERGCDFVYVHVEAPDECGHHGNTEDKIKAIEYIDKEILSPVYDYLTRRGEHFRIMVLPDHPTPVSVRTHTMDPVPFFIYDSKAEHAGVAEFTEESCKRQPLYIPDGYRLMEYLTGRIVP